MVKYEYKTVILDQKGSGIFGSRKIPDLEETLNYEGREGWRLTKNIMPSAGAGESTKIILIFERELI